MVPAAAVTPPTPEPKKLLKWSPLKAVMAMTTKSTSTASLMMTMIALIRADSVAPRSSSSMHKKTSTTAGRLMMPPVATPSSPGMNEVDRAWGIWKPKTESSSWLK